ncbi:MAG TPA: EAL domain-containing protein [Rhodoblastus sp.]|nr:EAL domain-containing protein [Rhodoblastus sp.]
MRLVVGSSFRRIVVVVLAAVLVVGCVSAAALLKLRQNALSEAGEGVTGLSVMLAEQVQRSNRSVEFAINEVEAALAANGPIAFGEAAVAPETLRAMAAAADKRPVIDVIEIFDAEGRRLSTSRGLPALEADARDEDAAAAAASREPRARVGLLRVSEATGELVVDISKPVAPAGGPVAGLVRVLAKPSALVSNYSPVSAMAGRSYALFTRAGRVLARYPNGVSLTAGQTVPPTSPFYATAAGGGGLYETTSAFDSEQRLIALHPVAFSDFIVTVSIATSTALAQWREQAAAIVMATLLALVIAAFLTCALRDQFRKLADKEAALRAQSSALELSNQRFAVALESMSQGLVVFDKSARVVICNTRYATLYGLKPDEITAGMPAREVLALRAAHGVYSGASPEAYTRDAMSRRFTDRRVDRLNDGRSIMVNHAVCADGGIVVTHEDITEREQANERIAHMAMHDELTQLANRALFLHTIAELRSRIGSDYEAIVVILFDLDDFKPVNDSQGHAAGDSILRECAARLAAAAPQAHVIARLGGDEFALAIGLRSRFDVDAEALAEQAVAHIRQPYVWQRRTLEINACAGIALIDDARLSTDDMLRRADVALYDAKAAGAGVCRMFEPHMELEALTKRALAADLAKAIAEGGLELFYQPVVDADTLRIRYMEALLRWRHPQLGPIPPLRFVRLAEETRQIAELGRWVLRRACADATTWPGHVAVAVNVSPLQLANGDFAAVVKEALDESGLEPARLELEITESVLLQDRGDDLAELRALRESGVSIALDDFGTGFASMSYLKRFPFDRLKIDRSFVADAPRDAGSAAIVAATIQLACAYDIEVTGEGVETYEQYQALRAAGVKLMQGYLFGRPEKFRKKLPAIDVAVSISSGHRVA